MTRALLPGAVVAILLLYFALRLHNLMALPLFIDETLHAERAVSVWHGSPLWFGGNGKYLGAWWVALFYPFPPQPWLIRVAVLLLTLPGASAVIVLAKRLFGFSAALCTGALVCFAPMLFFFDRMSLADTTLHPMLSLFVLSLFHLLDRRRFRRWPAFISGAMLAASVLAKATALAILPLPVIAVWILPRGWQLTDRIKALVWLFGTALGLWLPLLILMRLRRINYLGVPLSSHSADASNLWLLDRIIANLRFVLDGLAGYFGVVALLIALVATIIAVVTSFRRGIVVAMAVLGFSIAIVATGNTSVSLRYWLAVIPLAMVLVAGGLLVIRRWLTGFHFGSMLPAILLIVWVVFQALPFIATAYADPSVLALPEKDDLEYLAADSAGTMVPELAAFLTSQAASLKGQIVVTGAISQCYGLSLYLPPNSDIILDCPKLFDLQKQNGALDAYVATLARRHEHYYVVFEKAGLLAAESVTSVQLEPLAAFARPGGLVTITVYRPLLP